MMEMAVAYNRGNGFENKLCLFVSALSDLSDGGICLATHGCICGDKYAVCVHFSSGTLSTLPL